MNVPEVKTGRRDWLWLGLIVLLGLALRLYHLNEQSLWLDEAFSWLFTSQPVGTGIRLALIDFVHPPLYYLLLHFATLGSQSEFALRFPSALLGTLSIPLIYRLGRDLSSRQKHARTTGLLAAALLAVNPFHIWFSREARNYQLAFVLALLLLYLFHHLLKGRKCWIVFTVISALAYATHYFTLLLALVQFLYFLLNFKRHYRLFRRWFVAQVTAALPLAIWMIALFVQNQKSMGIAWIPQPRLITPLLTLWDFALLYAERWLSLGIWALPLFGLILILAFYVRQRRALLALWLGVPALTLVSISWLLKRNFYVDRYLIVSLPAFIVLLARGQVAVGELAPRLRKLCPVVAILLVLASTLSVGQVFWDPDLAKSDWRSVSQLLTSNYQQGDLVVLGTVGNIVPLHYYSPDSDWTFLADDFEQNSWPEIGTRNKRVWLVWRNGRNSSHLTGQNIPIDVYSEVSPATRTWLQEHYQSTLGQYSFPGISVLLIELKS